MGDRLSWDVQSSGGNIERATFDWLVTDSDYITNQNGGNFYTSHPDDAGRMYTLFAQDAPDVFGLLAPTLTGGQQGSGITFSYWYLGGGVARGLADFNYAHADGSVLRLNGVNIPYDDRTQGVPVTQDASNYSAWRQQIPAR